MVMRALAAIDSQFAGVLIVVGFRENINKAPGAGQWYESSSKRTPAGNEAGMFNASRPSTVPFRFLVLPRAQFYYSRTFQRFLSRTERMKPFRGAAMLTGR